VTADKVYLVGFMGAGKSTVARALAKRLDWRPVDIDQLIEQRERDTVAAIFARRGEPYFRAVERSVLVEQMASRHLVVATGGGTFADTQNRELINRDGVSVWLDVALERLIARVPPDGRRPLAADRAAFEQLYAARRAAYEHAHHRIDATRASVDAVVEELLHLLAH
jgi:shikimate kinase